MQERTAKANRTKSARFRSFGLLFLLILHILTYFFILQRYELSPSSLKSDDNGVC